MPRSYFFQERLKDLPPFSMLLFEGLEAAVEEAGVELGEDNVVQLLADAMQALRYDDPSLDRASEMAMRMSDMLEAEAEEYAALETEVKASSAKKPKKRTFGQAFLEWAQALSAEQICIYLADYDTERARFLYCEEDRTVVMRAYHLKLSADWHQIEAQLEAVVYGMGGGGDDSNSETYDLTSEDPEERKDAMDTLAAFFGGGGI